jgi:hypothetical protein
MRIAVAKSDFSVGMPGGAGQSLKTYQVNDGEDIAIRSDRIAGVIETTQGLYKGIQTTTGYLVEIEGQMVFIDERLLEVSQ